MYLIMLCDHRVIDHLLVWLLCPEPIAAEQLLAYISYCFLLSIVVIWCQWCCVFVKTLSVLHPLKQPDAAIMQDTDLAGPLVFCLAFGGCLLLVSAVLDHILSFFMSDCCSFVVIARSINYKSAIYCC